MDRIVDISRQGCHLSSFRGFMLVKENGTERGRVALEDIHAVLINAYDTTWTAQLVSTLAEYKVPLIFCDKTHKPCAITFPIDGNFAHNGRLHAQCAAPKPLKKRIWQHIVATKIIMQAALLKVRQHPEAASLATMARLVKSGDTSHVEGQAARLYWVCLMGREFRRDRFGDQGNSLLNYGYTVLRATLIRSIVSVGLHPAFGVGHINQRNSFALADDLMEPFRPLVDAAVLGMLDVGLDTLTPVAKSHLVRLISVDLPFSEGVSPLSVAATKLSFSLVETYHHKKRRLRFFAPPDELQWRALMETCQP